MRRGLHGGLFIRQPDPKPVAKAMAVYLDFEKVEPRQLDEARLAIEVFCVERVAARISEDEVAGWRLAGTQPATWVDPDGSTPTICCYVAPHPRPRNEPGRLLVPVDPERVLVPALRPVGPSRLANAPSIPLRPKPRKPVR
jgi:hypothetical protein